MQNAVFSLACDDDGFLWLGTIEGLVRFDGENFKSYVNTDETELALYPQSAFQTLRLMRTVTCGLILMTATCVSSIRQKRSSPCFLKR